MLSDYACGYLWCLGPINHHDLFMALDFGGQTVLTFPTLNLIVVTMANDHGNWDTADAQERAVLEIVSRYIFVVIGN